MIAHFFNFLGSLREQNDAILSLTDQLQAANGRAEMFRESALLWKRTARSIQDELDTFTAANARFIRVGKARIAALEKAKGRGK